MTPLILPPDAAFEEIAEPYDPGLDVGAALDAAFRRADRRRTRGLAKFGAAWCPDCRVLAGMMAAPAVAAFLEDHFEVVPVHVGRYDANMDAPAKVGLAGDLEGVPALVIAAPSGAVLNADRIYEWRTARERSLQDFADYLSAYAP